MDVADNELKSMIESLKLSATGNGASKFVVVESLNDSKVFTFFPLFFRVWAITGKISIALLRLSSGISYVMLDILSLSSSLIPCPFVFFPFPMKLACAACKGKSRNSLHTSLQTSHQ